MSAAMRIDFVSDVSCPWCAIGLKSLEQALARLDGAVTAEIHFQPFELNPQMPSAGQDINEHLAEKYGATPEQAEQTRAMIRARGEEVGFAFALDKRSIAVGTSVTRCPPHRSRRARFTHRAPTLGDWRRSVRPAMDEGYAQEAGTLRRAGP